MQILAAIPYDHADVPSDPRAAFVAAHQGAIWRYLRYLGCDRERSEDLLQDALLLGLRAGIHQRSGGQARAWLRTTARHLVLDRVRAEGRRPEHIGLPEVDVVWQEEEESPRREALRECLATLDGRSRGVLELRYGRGLGWRAIGDRLGGMKEQGVKTLLKRVRGALRACIERRCR